MTYLPRCYETSPQIPTEALACKQTLQILRSINKQPMKTVQSRCYVSMATHVGIFFRLSQRTKSIYTKTETRKSEDQDRLIFQMGWANKKYVTIEIFLLSTNVVC